MPYSLDELDFVRSHPEAVADAEQLELSKKTELANVTSLRNHYGENARGLVELVKAAEQAARPAGK